jgi:arylsulfatase A-like enzyme/predicted Zn-dependent protease
MRRALRLAAVVALAVAVAALIGRERFAGLLPSSARSLLLVSLDAVRADRLGCYGHAGARTPNLDALAARGLRFAQATTVAPLTLPAHASLLSGAFPSRHGVRDNAGFPLARDLPVLAEVLRERGYRTGAFVGSVTLGPHTGLDRGFERYDVGPESARSGAVVVGRAVEWLEEGRGPFFAWVHLHDPHAPHQAPEPYPSQFPPTPEGAYDAEIAWSDALLGRLLDALRSSGRLDRAVVAVAADHGESLGEHQERGHGFFVYDATVQVPLIVAASGLAPRTVSDQVSIVDVMPTVLELLGAPVPAAVQGRSLLADPLPPLPALVESWGPRLRYGWSELVALRDGRHKLIRALRPELYDLRMDPAETEDLAAHDPDRVAALERELQTMRGAAGDTMAPGVPSITEADVEDRLRALGDLDGALSARHLEDRPRADPKDRIGLYNLLLRARRTFAEGRSEEAIADVDRVLGVDGEVVEAHRLQGELRLASRRPEAASESFRAALALDPRDRASLLGLAAAVGELGRLEEAEAALERLRQVDPGSTAALRRLAGVWMRRGRLDRAEAALQEALRKGGDRPAVLLELAECYLEMKRPGDAERTAREALAERPEVAGGRRLLGLAWEARGERARAAGEYEAELARHPGDARAGLRLGRLLLEAGRPAEAAVRLRAAVEADAELEESYPFLARAQLDLGDLPGAVEWARRGLARDPAPRVASLGHQVLADAYSRMGRRRDAAREAAAARRLARGSPAP